MTVWGPRAGQQCFCYTDAFCDVAHKSEQNKSCERRDKGFHPIPVRTVWEQSRCNDFKVFLSVINPAPPQSGTAALRHSLKLRIFRQLFTDIKIMFELVRVIVA